MAKFGNIFKGNTFIISQTQHGFEREAIDCFGLTYDIFAPCDLKVDKQLHDSRTPYFEGFNNNFMIRFVHCKPRKPGFYKKGSIIGTYNVPEDDFPNHVHVVVQVNGKWKNFMEFLNRGVKLELGAGFGNDTKYKKWNYWKDSQLNIIPLFSEDNKYRIYEKDKLVKTLDSEDKAFSFWYNLKGSKITYKNKDITNKFKDMANALQQQITDLEKSLNNKNKEISELSSKIEALEKSQEEIAKLKEENLKLKRAISEVKATNTEFTNSFLGRLYILLNR